MNVPLGGFYAADRYIHAARDPNWPGSCDWRGDDDISGRWPRVQERLIDPSKRPPGSVPVEMVMLTYPLKPPADTPPDDTPRSAS